MRHSTMTFVRRGASLARVAGELHFDQEIRLVVRERILYHRLPAVPQAHSTGHQTPSYPCAKDEFYPTQPGNAHSEN